MNGREGRGGEERAEEGRCETLGHGGTVKRLILCSCTGE